MKKLCSFVFIVGLGFIEVNAAPTCSNVPTKYKNTKAINLIREMPPVRDQDGIGWCYGFTTADLLTHYLYKTQGKSVQGRDIITPDYRAKKFNVSAMGIAGIYNQTKNKDYGKSLKNKSSADLKKSNKKVVAEGGTIIGALLVAKIKGFCFEKDISSEDFSYVSDHRCAIKNRCKITEMLNIIYESPKEKIGCNDLHTIQKIFPSLKIQNINNILIKSAKQTALDNLVNASCKKQFLKKLPTDQPKVESKTIKFGQSPNELMSFLDNHLDRGIPVGIMYFADFLTGNSGSVSAHASSIVGKAFNPETCEVEYILRNSWGQGCGPYLKENPSYTKCAKNIKSEKNSNTYFTKLKVCKNSFKPAYRNPRIRCDEPTGHVFVRQSDLAKQIYNTTAIQVDKSF